MFSSCYLRLCNEPYDLGDLQNRQRHISNWPPGWSFPELFVFLFFVLWLSLRLHTKYVSSGPKLLRSLASTILQSSWAKRKHSILIKSPLQSLWPTYWSLVSHVISLPRGFRNRCHHSGRWTSAASTSQMVLWQALRTGKSWVFGTIVRFQGRLKALMFFFFFFFFLISCRWAFMIWVGICFLNAFLRLSSFLHKNPRKMEGTAIKPLKINEKPSNSYILAKHPSVKQENLRKP